MEDFNIKNKEFIGIIVPDAQNSVSKSKKSFLKVVPSLFNASFDPAMKAFGSVLSGISSSFTSAVINGTSSFVESFDSVSSFFTNGSSFPNSPIDTSGGGNRYLVHIPDLMPFINSLDGIWVYNATQDTQANKNNNVDDLVYGDFLSRMFGDVLSGLGETVSSFMGLSSSNIFTSLSNSGSSYSTSSSNYSANYVTNSSSSAITSTGWKYFNNVSSGEALSSTTLDYNNIASFQVFGFIDEAFINFLIANGADPKIIEAARCLMLLAKNARNPNLFSKSDCTRIVQGIRGVDEEQLNSYYRSYCSESGVYPTDFSLLLSNGYDLDNIANYLESINVENLSTDTEDTEYDSGSCWGCFVGADDVVSCLASTVTGNALNGALGTLSGGFLNFSLKNGSVMAPFIGDTNSGQYKSLTPGTKVIVRFLENDFNSGQIIRVLPYDSQLGSQYSNYKSTLDDLEDLYPSLYKK